MEGQGLLFVFPHTAFHPVTCSFFLFTSDITFPDVWIVPA